MEYDFYFCEARLFFDFIKSVANLLFQNDIEILSERMFAQTSKFILILILMLKWFSLKNKNLDVKYLFL